MGGHYQTAGVYTCDLMLSLVSTPLNKKTKEKVYGKLWQNDFEERVDKLYLFFHKLF